tara:strand:+ start:468 stop:728 length:261 start_codon:yes stop_codon:yes gene_type:complete
VDKSQLKNKIKEILDELTEEDLEEITTTAAAPGYMTPMAFSPKKKKKKIKEELEPKDVQQVRKIVKDIINNMFRDIWLKRNSWNRI